MALALATVVIVIGAGLTALMFFVAFEETRLSESGTRLAQAFGVAEEGVFEVLRAWDPRTYNPHDPYPFDSALVPAGVAGTWAPASHGTGAYRGQVYKLNGELYLIDIGGRDRPAEGSAPWGAHRRLGLLAHVGPIVPGVAAALTVGKGNRWSGAISVDGQDELPSQWEPCGPRDTTRAGLRAPGGLPPGFGDARVSGAPPALSDAVSVRSGVLLGGFAYADLASLATRAISGGLELGPIGPAVVDDRCDETVATNWGGAQPDRPCGGYLPVVHVVGDVTLAGGEGQGMLVADGDVVVRGDLRWRGVLVAGRTLRVRSGLRVWGVVFVGDSAILEPGLAESVAITYSKCAIVKALESVTPAKMLPSRGWIGLSEAP